MPALTLAPGSIAVSAATSNGICTVASTAGLKVSMKGWLTKSAVTSDAIVVAQILSATTFMARKYGKIDDQDFGIPGGTYSGSGGGSDLSAFNSAATFYWDIQVVDVAQDGTSSIAIA